MVWKDWRARAIGETGSRNCTWCGWAGWNLQLMPPLGSAPQCVSIVVALSVPDMRHERQHVGGHTGGWMGLRQSPSADIWKFV